jgi:hypothetical protein
MCEIEKRQKLEMRSDCYACLWIIGDLIKYTHFSKTRYFGTISKWKFMFLSAFVHVNRIYLAITR